MQRLLCGLLLCAVLLTGCQRTSKKTDTPSAPAHNVPSAVYPAPEGENLDKLSALDSDKAGGAYPSPQDGNKAALAGPHDTPVSSAGVYPAPGTPDGSALINEYAPAPGDESLTRGNAFMDAKASGVILLESFPLQVKLHLKGSLPNPCYALRVNPIPPTDQKRIDVEVYSLIEPGKICTEVLKDFDVILPLGSYPSGHYSIYINEELLGEFDT